MLIEFVKNPQFQPPAPPIKVGSVVMCGTKKGVVSCVENSCIPYRIRLSIDKEVCALRDGVVWLPEKVSGITEQGEWEYAPIKLPPQEFSWEQYPPRAGMVVQATGGSTFRVLCSQGCEWASIYQDCSIAASRMSIGSVIGEYRPRPDLMPRFVEQKQ